MPLTNLDLTLPTPEENLALDEALLDAVEAGAPEVLRTWESPDPVVVVGRASRLALEVDETACQQARVPILRRTSGGAAIVAGPGCLMYALVLRRSQHPPLASLAGTHPYVLERLCQALDPLAQGVRRRGISDLALGPLKFSGNSLRVRRHALLYHGTLLYDFPLQHISSFLRMPPRQPDYRQQRSHDEFLTNLGLSAEVLRSALTHAWQAHTRTTDWPRERVAELVRTRYRHPAWLRGE